MAAKNILVISGAMHTWSRATLENTARGQVGSVGSTYCSRTSKGTQRRGEVLQGDVWRNRRIDGGSHSKGQVLG